ncbi:hypothetical protein NMG60_11007215 [Bertholletia excelsa]
MAEGEIAHFDFSTDVVGLGEGSEEWKVLRDKVRKACEERGCFVVKYDKNVGEEREELLKGTEELFRLPEDAKKKHDSPCRFNGYYRSPFSSLHESFGIDASHRPDAARDFSLLMWPPHGNPTFREALQSVSSKMLELNLIVLKLICESFGLGDYYTVLEQGKQVTYRLTKYNSPPTKDPTTGLIAHTDKEFLTSLCQSGVQGLEILSNHGTWIPVSIPSGSFVIIVGDCLKAWSNGRLRAPKHRVIMREEKERYSWGLFLAPGEKLTIEVPRGLVDEDHPLRYRPFTYPNFLTFYNSSNFSDEALELFAGV